MNVKRLWVRFYDIILYASLIILSSPYLFVFDDDLVTSYTGAVDVASDDIDS